MDFAKKKCQSHIIIWSVTALKVPEHLRQGMIHSIFCHEKNEWHQQGEFDWFLSNFSDNLQIWGEVFPVALIFYWHHWGQQKQFFGKFLYSHIWHASPGKNKQKCKAMYAQVLVYIFSRFKIYHIITSQRKIKNKLVGNNLCQENKLSHNIKLAD